MLKKFLSSHSTILQLLIFAAALIVYYITRCPAYCADNLVAWPLTDQLMHPDFYSPDDLLIKAGLSGNFLLYRLLVFVPFCRDNFALRDLLLYAPIFLLWCAAWYALYRELSASSITAFFSLLLLLFSDQKMGLNWSFVPQPVLLSFSSVNFAQVFALLLFLRGRAIVSFVIIAASGYFHPATALCYGSVLGAMCLFDSVRNKRWRPLVGPVLFGLIIAPNLMLIGSHSQGFLGNSAQFWERIEQLQPHIFIEDHFKEGYAYTLAVIGLSMIALARGGLVGRHGTMIMRFLVFGFSGCVLWLINAYWTHSISVLYTYFLPRFFYIVKPLLVLFVVQLASGMVRGAPSLVRLGLGTTFIATLFFFSPTIALIIAMAMVPGLLGRPGLAVAMACGGIAVHFAFSAAGVTHAVAAGVPHSFLDLLKLLKQIKSTYMSQSHTIFEIACLCAALPLFVMYARKGLKINTSPPDRTLLKWSAAALVLLVACACVRHYVYPDEYFLKDYSIKRNYGLCTLDPAYSEVVSWAKGTPGKMFIVPPLGPSAFRSFRYLTKKGVYLQGFDIYQLGYSPDFMDQAFARLSVLGVTVQGRHVFDGHGYYSIPLAAIKSTRADYIIFDRPQFTNVQGFRSKPVFENQRYVVYAIADLGAGEK